MGDRRKCQTYAASPAEPGGLPVMLGRCAIALPPEMPDNQDRQRIRCAGNGCRDTCTLGDAICIAKKRAENRHAD